MAAGAIIGGAVSVIGGIFGSSRARREARRREAQARALESKLNPLMQFVTNLQKQLAEEEKEEKTANEQKNK